jgi:hypothetical protein
MVNNAATEYGVRRIEPKILDDNFSTNNVLKGIGLHYE